MSDQAKHVIDTISVSAAFATVFGWLPHIAALLSVVWSLIRIYETKTVQRILGIKPKPYTGEDRRIQCEAKAEE